MKRPWTAEEIALLDPFARLTKARADELVRTLGRTKRACMEKATKLRAGAPVKSQKRDHIKEQRLVRAYKAGVTRKCLRERFHTAIGPVLEKTKTPKRGRVRGANYQAMPVDL